MKYLAIALAAAALLSGCSWTGEISRDFYVGNSSVNQYKEDSVVGLIPIKTKDVKYGQSVDYRLDVNNFIYAVQSEFLQHFRNVVVIKNESECSECGLFSRASAGVSINQNAETYRSFLQCDFYDRSGQFLTRLSSTSSGDASPSAALNRKTAVNGFLLGALAASTISDYGEFLKEVSENAISEVVSEVGRQIPNDPKLNTSLALQMAAAKAAEDAEQEESRKEAKKRLAEMDRCVQRTIRSIDDGISDATTIAQEAGRQCGLFVERTIRTLCASEKFSSEECQMLADRMNTEDFFEKRFTRFILNYRIKKNF